MKKYVNVTCLDTSQGKTKVIATAVLNENGTITFEGQTDIFPEEIATLGGKTVTPADGLAYLLALPSVLDSAYATAGDVEEDRELPNAA
ncbi:hypothetical protein COY93_04890 [Candidatus Uhrbacteria bacterium CG_4_10_14_0_8_um_filter_58_22]|uniref:Uncharacterized protein n=1 Tax=Candidatus Uhrbacteria bacterium CG_4_10_14_0_8_um_filter_58_22 TaxID=1975029 RepID=A0A2M7Q9F6_9BACT|nr:MAG: hypothetical protein AUJ19_04515 [Parcubacteria group bacterium CG1_02_58_44]PIY61714.1 MAG: hypothetical protein COY93_04890 [Candidatus Uhrbacteria bacterium CG_4_10_14_0_8_um_filter_58_22]